ncbi:thiolase-like protein [Phaeosphaeriaceae sp. PMI808]|nr:thiolase-like protein [Phaeosphaeriaceae sp. PMI808]
MVGKKQPVYVLGVGMTKFIKPRGKVDYPELGFEAGVKAMLDAHINYDDVEQGVACYCYGDSTCGQRVFYQFGMTGIPVYNVNNNCSTGSTGLYMGRNMIAHGAADCVLVVGFEKMFPGSLQTFFQDRSNPTATTTLIMKETRGVTNAPGAAQLFGNAGREHMEKYGSKLEDFAEIGRINHAHSKNNPYSQFQDEYTLEQVVNSTMIHEPLTKLQCCPTSDGAAAAVLVSQEFLDKRPELKDQAILIAGQRLATDTPNLFNRSAIELIGYSMSELAAKEALAEANVTPADVKVCELHDCFSANEMVTIEALGLAPKGKAHELIRKGGITYGGQVCSELVWHLRGWANNRSAEDTKVALQHNLGLGGAVVCTVYKRADGSAATDLTDEQVAKKTGLGYNPATQAKGFTKEQVDSVRSKTARSEWALQDIQQKVESRF